MKFAAKVASLGLLALATVGRAEETKVPLGEVPKAVLDAIKVKFPAAEMTQAEKEVEDGKTIFEVGLKDKGAAFDVAVTAAGKIVEIEKVITAKDLPKAVTASVDAKHPGATIKKAEEIVESEGDKETKSYEVIVTTKENKLVEVKLSPEGRVLETEDKGDAGKGDKKD